MQHIIKAVHYKLLFLLLTVSETVFMFFYEWHGDKNYKEGLALSLMFVFLYAIFILLLKLNEKKLFEVNNSIYYLYIGLLLSGFFVCLSETYPIHHLWMLGCLILAAAYSIYLGIVSLALFLCLDGICQDYSPEKFIFYGILGVVLCMLIAFFPTEKRTVKLVQTYFYYIIIGVSCHITLYLVTNSLNYTRLYKTDTITGIVCTAVIITIIYFIMLTAGNLPVQRGIEDFLAVDKEETNNDTVEEDVITQKTENFDSLEKFLSDDFELLESFRKKLPAIYKHCKIVCDISRNAAKSIDADEDLAAAGGLYHEIGKLSECGNYIENNMKYAEEYNFPNKLKSILIEHNMNFEIPHSKESAVVFFTDSILSTLSYLVNVKKVTNVPKKTVIESYFAKRLEDMNLDESGLTIKDFKVLKNYYIEYFKEES